MVADLLAGIVALFCCVVTVAAVVVCVCGAPVGWTLANRPLGLSSVVRGDWRLAELSGSRCSERAVLRLGSCRLHAGRQDAARLQRCYPNGRLPMNNGGGTRSFFSLHQRGY
jgi:hypothetical protein